MNANAVAFVPSPSSSPTDDGVAYLMKQMQSTYGFTDLEVRNFWNLRSKPSVLLSRASAIHMAKFCIVMDHSTFTIHH